MQHNHYSNTLNEYIKIHAIQAEHLIFNESCHSVEEAAQAANASIDDFVKNICMIDNNNRLIVAIVKGSDRASTSRVAKSLNITRPRVATKEEILEKTGFPCGGTPSFGFQAQFLIDPKVMECAYIYTGGGCPNSLVKITPQEFIKQNNALIARIRK